MEDSWEKTITEYMQNGGWTKDRDDETTLGFSYFEGDAHWIRDYDKKRKRFVQYDGNQKVIVRCIKKVEKIE